MNYTEPSSHVAMPQPPRSMAGIITANIAAQEENLQQVLDRTEKNLQELAFILAGVESHVVGGNRPADPASEPVPGLLYQSQRIGRMVIDACDVASRLKSKLGAGN